jgi:hypothetical protein
MTPCETHDSPATIYLFICVCLMDLHDARRLRHLGFGAVCRPKDLESPQRGAIKVERQCFTLRLTRHTVAIMFSMISVHASDPLSRISSPSQVLVRISSNPEQRLRHPGSSRSKRRARLWIGLSAPVVDVADLAKHAAHRSAQRRRQPAQDGPGPVYFMATQA